MNSFLAILINCLIGASAFLVTFPGQCPKNEVLTIRNFQEEKMEGTWYVLMQYQAPTADCYMRGYHWYDKGSFLSSESSKNVKTECATYSSSNTLDQIGIANNEGKYRFRGYPTYNASTSYYYFVDTDYDNYIIVWTCIQDEDKNYQNLLVMAKNWNTDIHSLDINKTLDKKPFDRNKMHFVKPDKRCIEYDCGGKPTPNSADDDSNNKDNGNNTAASFKITSSIMIIIGIILVFRY